MAEIYNTTIDQGATWSLLVTYKDPNGNPINLTGATAAMQLRTSPMANTAALTLTTQNSGIAISGPSGQVSISATATQTGLLKAQKYTYDLEVYLGQQTIRLIEGTILVIPETTRI